MFQFLTWVGLGLFERDLTHGFHVTSVSGVVVACANVLYILLEILPVRPSEEKIKEHLPDLFQGKIIEIVQETFGSVLVYRYTRADTKYPNNTQQLTNGS